MSEDIEEQTLQNFIEENRVEEKVVEKENRKELLFYNEGLDVSKNITIFIWTSFKSIGSFIFNQSGHEASHHRLGIGGGQTPIRKYFSEIFSPSHIRLPNKTRIEK